MNPSISIKIIKYALNLFGLTWILFVTDLSFGLVVFRPKCDFAIDIVWNQLKNLAPFYLLFVGCAAGINFFIERKLEKRKRSREFLLILIAEFILLGIIAFSISSSFCNSCINY
jgi:hypothetical protein